VAVLSMPPPELPGVLPGGAAVASNAVTKLRDRSNATTGHIVRTSARAVSAAAHEYSLPSALVHDLLSGAYGAQLYGGSASLPANASDRRGMDLSTLRIIWPYLLSDPANESLNDRRIHGLCRASERPTSERKHAAASQRFLFMTSSFINRAAIWVHQPGGGIPMPDLSDHDGHVEVTHCFYGNRQEHTNHYTPMWFFHAPGSGVAVRLGRALLVVDSKRRSELRYVLTRTGFPGSIPGSEQYRNRLATYLNASGLVDGTRAAKQLDSIVFANVTSPSWGGEHLTEIVLLRTGGREMSHLPSILPHLRCGRSPDGLRVGVRACRVDEPALTVHGELCDQRPVGWLAEVYGNISVTARDHACVPNK
jgi:hypothetical protein